MLYVQDERMPYERSKEMHIPQTHHMQKRLLEMQDQRLPEKRASISAVQAAHEYANFGRDVVAEHDLREWL